MDVGKLAHSTTNRRERRRKHSRQNSVRGIPSLRSGFPRSLSAPVWHHGSTAGCPTSCQVSPLLPCRGMSCTRLKHVNVIFHLSIKGLANQWDGAVPLCVEEGWGVRYQGAVYPSTSTPSSSSTLSSCVNNPGARLISRGIESIDW